MKIFFTPVLTILSFTTQAQWSNTTNQFYDSLAMPVCTATGDQRFPVVQRSYPDSGYFVIWEDNRVGPNYNHTQIYAQKYDKNGNGLWADNGVQVAVSPNPLHFNLYTANHLAGSDFRQSNSVDLRDFSFTATDSSNGFYITYMKDSLINQSHFYSVFVQHIGANGTPVFPEEGYRIQSGPGSPQLIADGNRGFFIGYYTRNNGLEVQCYRDENGTMKFYGGGRADVNAFQDTVYNYKYTGCRELLVAQDLSIHCDGNFSLYPNKQDGCGIVMTMYKDFSYAGEPYGYTFTAYNELVRVKKDSRVTTDDPASPVDYSKGDVMLLYQVRNKAFLHDCGGPGNGFTTVTDFIMTSNGFQRISQNHDYAYYAKGTILSTDGNINANVIGVTEKDNDGDFVTRVYYRTSEKYDSIPYTFTDSDFSYITLPPGQDKINWGSGDTLFFNTSAYGSGGLQHVFNFSLVSSKDKVYASAFLEKGSNQYDILMQQLKLEKQTSDSFAVVLNTNNKNGIKVATDNTTGLTSTRLSYNPPYISTDNEGHALFYIIEKGAESGYLLRVSPVADGSRMAWGSVGRPVRNIYTNFSVPYVMMSPNDGTAVIAWRGIDNGLSPSSDEGIYIRHLDNLDVRDYTPPVGKVKLLLTGGGHFDGLKHLSPNYISGLSGKWNTFNYGDNIPVAGLLDNNNLGIVGASAYQNWHGGSIRLYKGQPYLDRNYTIVPQNSPVLPQPVRLYFTNEEMDALKAADPSITGPEMLQVVKQPSASDDAPSVFTHTTEEVITPSSWGLVDGGYYLEINVNSFSNFFIQKINGPLPVTWIDVQAKWMDKTNAQVSWQVVNQVNVKKYNVQHSDDGIQFTNVCEVAAGNTDFYNCTVPDEQNRVHYYRIQQTDIDGKNSFSKVVKLSSHTNESVYIFPNPVSSEIRITGLRNFSEYTITDISGKIILKQKITQANVIPVSFLKQGAYILKLIGGTDTRSLKFLKE